MSEYLNEVANAIQSRNNKTKSDDNVLCNDAEVPVWIISRGNKMFYDRPAFTDDDGSCPMSQMRDDECLIAPGAIYRTAKGK